MENRNLRTNLFVDGIALLIVAIVYLVEIIIGWINYAGIISAMDELGIIMLITMIITIVLFLLQAFVALGYISVGRGKKDPTKSLYVLTIILMILEAISAVYIFINPSIVDGEGAWGFIRRYVVFLALFTYISGLIEMKMISNSKTIQ